jgi:hypothetical protein
MNKQLINKLKAVTALTVVGTTASIICSQTAGHSNSLTDISVDRQTVIESTTQTVLSAFSNSRTFDSDIKVSRSVQDNAKNFGVPSGQRKYRPSKRYTPNPRGHSFDDTTPITTQSSQAGPSQQSCLSDTAREAENNPRDKNQQPAS